jgi:hypothetical protein
VYHLALVLHSLLRWAVLALGLLAVVSVVTQGAAGRRRVLPFVIALDLQLLLGLSLYLFLSPLTRGHGGGAALRFWRAVHPAMAVVSVLAAHAGNVLLKRSGREQRIAAGLLLLAALILAAALVPWDRPMLRLR